MNSSVDTAAELTANMAADRIISACTLNDRGEHLYIIAPFINPVSFRAQQNRALNLAWALQRKGAVAAQSVAVIGGGLAGMTTALALRSIGCSVTLYDSRPSVLHRQSATTHRVIHPTLNKWPQEKLNPTTNFPFFDWVAGQCSEVTDGLEREWKTIRHKLLPEPRLGHLVSKIGRKDGRFNVRSRKAGRQFDDPFDAVVIATGFQEEAGRDKPKNSYWSGDSRRPPWGTEQPWVVGGCGDGGVVDALRLCHNKFQSGNLVVTAAAMLQGDPVARQIEVAESNGAAAPPGTDTSAQLKVAYMGAAALIPSGLREILKDSLGPAAIQPAVLLVGPSTAPFLDNTAPIHKLLLAHAMGEGAIEFRRGRVAKRGAGYLIPDESGGTERVSADRVIPRYGTVLNLALLDAAQRDLLRRRVKEHGDQLDSPLWRMGSFPLKDEPKFDTSDEAFVSSRRLLLRKYAAESFVVEVVPGGFRVREIDPANPPLALPENFFGIPVKEIVKANTIARLAGRNK